MQKIINPANEELLYEYEYINREELDNKIKKAEVAYKSWKNTSFAERKEKFKSLSEIMLKNKEELAKLDTIEMGMLYSGALGDVNKTAIGISYAANIFEKWLEPIKFNEGGISGKRVFEPIGVLYSISPWNFPYNQVFRNATANILAGNVVLSKHASNVVGIARKIEILFLQAGFPEGVYQNIEINSSESEYLISHELIKGINITGGDKAGRAIGELAGKNLKPSILELGGIDPFIVLDTKNLDKTVKLAASGRLSSCGQKCNSSKKFIVVEKYYTEFCEKLANIFSNIKIGDPFDSETIVGPLSSLGTIKELERITENAIKDGAKLLVGGKRINMRGFYFEPTVICDVKVENSLFDIETFGPIASVIKAKDKNDAIKLANNSKYGLTACIITDSTKLFEEVASKLDTGSVFHNKIPTSYPFLPYGGVKDSGYGKELGERGCKNFMNEKVIVY